MLMFPELGSRFGPLPWNTTDWIAVVSGLTISYIGGFFLETELCLPSQNKNFRTISNPSGADSWFCRHKHF